MGCFLAWARMRRPPRRRGSTVDLIGFLDILSTVMVIVLMVISILSLSLGLSTTKQPPRSKQEPQQVADSEPTPVNLPTKPRVELKTAAGTRITESSSFLLCRAGQLEHHDPSSGTIVERWSLITTSPLSIAQAIPTRTVYMVVASDCFTEVDGLVNAMRSTGLQVGYEPMAGDGSPPWE